MQQGGYQLLSIVLTIVVAVIGGAVTGKRITLLSLNYVTLFKVMACSITKDELAIRVEGVGSWDFD